MKKALFIAGGWSGHEPIECSEIVAGWLKELDYDVEISDSLESLQDTDRLANFDLVVPCVTMGEISKEQMESLQTAVKNGCGIGGWHGGMCDSFRSNADYQFMTGGQFVSHPGGLEMTYRVTVRDPFHPIMKGIESFDYSSEQYYMHVDPNNNVLATTVFDGSVHDWIDGAVMPVAWTRSFGKGKVFYHALGHQASELERPVVRKLTTNGLVWATR